MSVPVLGCIPVEEKEFRKEIKNVRNQENTKVSIMEAYRSLRTSIKFSLIDKPIKTIVVTSSLAGEGKSTVVGNLAYSLSQDGARVLVIDCDLRKPSIHENFYYQMKRD